MAIHPVSGTFIGKSRQFCTPDATLIAYGPTYFVLNLRRFRRTDELCCGHGGHKLQSVRSIVRVNNMSSWLMNWRVNNGARAPYCSKI